MRELSKVKRLKLRDVWSKEAADFTPWLADNLEALRLAARGVCSPVACRPEPNQVKSNRRFRIESVLIPGGRSSDLEL